MDKQHGHTACDIQNEHTYMDRQHGHAAWRHMDIWVCTWTSSIKNSFSKLSTVRVDFIGF
jgi:hypothetical protein